MLRGRSHVMRSKMMVKRHVFKLMSEDYHCEVAKISELVWFRSPATEPKPAEQWREAHWVGKSERSDEHLLAIRGSTCSARTIRRKPREELDFGDCQSCVGESLGTERPYRVRQPVVSLLRWR